MTNESSSPVQDNEQADTDVPMSEIRAWLDTLHVLYCVHVARAAAEHEAHLLGLLPRHEDDASEVLLHGMWHMLAEAVLHAPIPTSEKGRRLLDADDRTPARYRALDIENPGEADTSPSHSSQYLEIAGELNDILRSVRALSAFQTARDRVLAIDENTHQRWRFAAQIVGHDPITHPEPRP
ncbi:hypothetical protein ACWDYH_02675 [Nocardia goodfellowii]